MDRWRSLGGDVNWATLWVDRWLRQRKVPQFVIVPDSAVTLQLFAEAITLVPAEYSSGVSFLTSLSAERSGVRFDWIGLPAHSEMAGSMLKQFPERVLDLSRPRGPAPAAVAARSRATPPPLVTSAAPSGALVSVAASGDLRPPLGSIAVISQQSSEEAPLFPPPPPPPPPPPLAWNAQRVLAAVVAACLCVGIGVGVGWWLFAARSGTEQKVAILDGKPAEQAVESPPAAAPEIEPAPSAPKSAPQPDADGPAARPAVGPPSQSERAPGSGERLDPAEILARSEPAIVKFVDKGLLESLKDQPNAEEYVPLLTADLPPDGKATLLAPSSFDMRLDPLDPAGKAPPGNFKIALKTSRGEAVAFFRLHGSGLLWKCRGEPNDELLDALRLCNLEIRSPSGPGAAPPSRVVFTPLMPAAPTGREWLKKPFSEDLISFCASIYKRRQALKPRLRVERLSLSILPPDNDGWRSVDPGEAVVPNPVESRFTIGKLAASLGLKPHFDRDDQDSGSPPIEVAFKVGDGDDSKNPGKTTKSDPKLPDKKREPRDKQLAEGDGELIEKMFRRFGEVHGSIVIQTGDDGADQDLEVLRFGTSILSR